MATNRQMIEEMANVMGFEYTGMNLYTFNEWAKEGLIVKKGEKAFMSLKLWHPYDEKQVDENNKPIIDEKTGKQKIKKSFVLKLTHLFTAEQVEKGELKKKAATKKPAAKKKKKVKHTFTRIGA
jgi:hypothetical protein